MAKLQEQTAPLDSVDLRKAFSKPKRSRSNSIGIDLLSVAAIYELLLYAPDEYLTRALRSEFLRRALAAEAVFGFAAEGVNTTENGVHSVTVIREFIRRTLTYVGTVEHSVCLHGCFASATILSLSR